MDHTTWSRVASLESKAQQTVARQVPSAACGALHMIAIGLAFFAVTWLSHGTASADRLGGAAKTARPDRLFGGPGSTYSPRRHLQTWLGLHAGVASEFTFESDYSVRYGGTFGFQAGVGAVWSVFGLAAEMRLTFLGDPTVKGGYEYTNDGPASAAMMSELMVKPRFGHRFRELPMEIYVAFPHGAGYGGPDQDLLVNFALSVGATWFVYEHWGLNAEIGLTRHVAGFHSYDTKFTEWTLLRASVLWAR